MNDFRPILVGVDRSAGARAAIRYAAVLASRLRRDLCLLYVAPDSVAAAALLPAAALGSGGRFHAVGDDLLAEARLKARELVPNHHISTRIAVGERATQILEHARDAALVVLGDDRDPTLGRLTVGYLLAAVAAGSEVPVVCVPGHWVEPLDGTQPRWGRGRRIVVGVKDPWAIPDELLLRAFEIAGRQGAVLDVVHVLDPSSGPAVVQEVEHALAAAAELASATYPSVAYRAEAPLGRAADVLRERSLHADLLVLSRPRKDQPLQNLGPTGRSLLRAVECPVEVMPVLETANGTAIGGLSGGVAVH